MAPDTETLEIDILKILSFHEWHELISSFSAGYNLLLIFDQIEVLRTKFKISEIKRFLENCKKISHISGEEYAIYYINFFSQIDKELSDSDRLMMERIDVGSPDGFTGRGKKNFIDKIKEFLSRESGDNILTKIKENINQLDLTDEEKEELAIIIEKTLYRAELIINQYQERSMIRF